MPAGVVVQRGVELVEFSAQLGQVGEGVAGRGQSWADQSGVGLGEDDGGAQAVIGDGVAVAVRDPGDQPVDAQSTQVVGRLSGGHGAGKQAQQGRECSAARGW